MKPHIDIHFDLERDSLETQKTLKKLNMEMNMFQATMVDEIKEMLNDRFSKYIKNLDVHTNLMQ